jgi:hypothetical protein
MPDEPEIIDDPAEKPLIHLPRVNGDPFVPTELAASVVIKRGKSDGTAEICELYEPESGMWSGRFPVPISREIVLKHWGSGTYRLWYQNPAGQSAGGSRKIELDLPEHPQKPARAGGPVFRAPARPAAPPVVPLEAPRPASAPAPFPVVPENTPGTTLIAIMAWAEDRAQRNADERVLRAETYARQQLDTERARHQRDMDDMEMRARRDREDQAARHQRFMESERAQAEASLRIASSRSGREELEERIAELEEAKEKAPDDGGIMGVVGKIASNPQAQAMLGALLQQVAQQPKIGGGG